MATTITVLDQCQVTPQLASSATEIHYPLTFLDMMWLHFGSIQLVVFYKIPHLSTFQFVGDIIPKLKDSLSLTLKYFPILAGDLIIHPNSYSDMPEICYKSGNGVAFIVAACNNADSFHRLVSNDERDCAEFYPFIPELKSSSENSESSVSSSPVLAMQITLFPEVGLSICFSHHHTVGDQRSIVNYFMKTWSFLNSKLSRGDLHTDAEAQLLVSESLPVFDKNLIQDKKGLAKIILDKWNDIIKFKRLNCLSPESTTSAKVNKVRKTFVISPKEVKKLKNSVPNLVHVSSFTVICSYVWTCLVKSRQVMNHVNMASEDRDEYFVFAADCRERSDPPIPANYFGNCVSTGLMMAKTAELAGEGGFQIAAELLERAIHEKFKHKDAVFDGEETAFETGMTLNRERMVSVAGSPRYSCYDLDFGWGNPMKVEFISIDQSGAISLGESRDSNGSVEVGISLPNSQMKAFSGIFMAKCYCQSKI